MTDHDAVLVNVSEAARIVGLPRSTVAAWVRRERLFPRGLDVDGINLYDLEDVRALADGVERRPSGG